MLCFALQCPAVTCHALHSELNQLKVIYNTIIFTACVNFF